MSKRPLIAVDCDGVLYCWDRTARYMLREKLKRENWPIPEALTAPSTSWGMIQDTVPEEDWDWLWTEGVEQGLFRHGDIMSGAIFGIQALSRWANLMIVTSRPQQGVYDTMSWLLHHLRPAVPLVGLHILSHGQPKSTVQPTPDLLIDDGLHNLSDWTRNTDSQFVLFDQPWNSWSGPLPLPGLMTGRALRGFGWEDTVRKAKGLLTPWNERSREVI